jgi:antitoxin PrlF
MESTLTVKGQITLPKAVRNALHLKTGDKIMFEEQGDGAFLLRPRTTDVQMLKGCVTYKGTPKTLDEMDAAIAAHAGSNS